MSALLPYMDRSRVAVVKRKRLKAGNALGRLHEVLQELVEAAGGTRYEVLSCSGQLWVFDADRRYSLNDYYARHTVNEGGATLCVLHWPDREIGELKPW